ncbi:RNA recognition motif domain containing protein [Theileria equi strain WA]|uniref:RNA recognition motif domain containing protein n=1 Tax=Theileria equi strain WA TaxID=1537102 RepID=L0AZ62_THEEQ|nr:RNA recognition motif domain containing protein [Theileria equi strain WA]AFZ80533.1 RNA recognition motif domain containing protein [Theileria equi strain WA]|eukprot:XP_004830199.1 RNA recognition motif domain containing protein [Theileria equi strain WA]
MTDSHSWNTTPQSKSYYTFDDPLNEKKLRVWVGSIPNFVEADDLKLALQMAGVAPLTDLVFKRCPVRSWGFLTFKTFEDASQCIALIHGKRLFEESDFTLEARFANPHESRDDSNSRNDSFNSQSSFLSTTHRASMMSTLTEEGYDVLQDAGPTTLWHVYRDENGNSYYYNSITGHTQWERPVPPLIAVEAATSFCSDRNRLSAPPGSNLFIFHIPNVWDDAELAMHFTPFGNLISAKVQRDAAGCNSGFGFVTYDNPLSASAAVDLMNGFATHSKFLKVQHKKESSNEA